MTQFFGVAWYRFRATLGHRWGSYLSVVLLIGLLGGIAMASIAAGRRTQSSYPTFLASTNPSDLTVSVYNPGNGAPGAALTSKLAHLAGVKSVVSLLDPSFFPLAANGVPRLQADAQLVTAGSVDGMLVDQDRLAVVQGRLANPSRADEIVMPASAAQILGAHVGQVVPLGLYTDAQRNLAGFGTSAVLPRLLVRAKLVGIVSLNTELVQDDVDQSFGLVFLTPALVREALRVEPTATPVLYGLQLDEGTGGVREAEQEIVHLVPRGLVSNFHVTSRVVTEVELAVKPESVALGGFGAIAGMVALVLGIQAISRQLRFGDEERRVLRALGAAPAAAVGDALIGILGAVALGALLALAEAVLLSPLFPIGPVRAVYPNRGISFDWTVLAAGLAVLLGVLGAATAWLTYRGAPHRVDLLRSTQSRRSTVTRGAEAAGMSVSGVIGFRFALDSGRGRTSVPVRSALYGTVLAIALVVATVTFASSLTTLVSHPALYGWNWNYALNPSGNVPPQSLKLLDHDPDVAAWTGFDYNNVEIDGQNVPVLLGPRGAAVSPPILSGHALDANNQIVIGAATLAVLHKHVGDTVFVSFGTRADAPLYVPRTPLVIVGTATFPAVGFVSFIADHTSMGTGALFSEAVLPPALQQALHDPDRNLNGPQLVFVRLRNGVAAESGHADMQRITAVANKVFANDPDAAGNYVTVLGVQRPAQIVNYRSIGSTPVVLAVGLAAGAVVALGLTLVASVRRRRRDLALLKALGFTQRQLAAAVAWQATIDAVIGIIAGIPIGIVVGRELWTVFARNLNAVPDPTVPLLSILLVGVGALVFANVVAALPGRSAAHTSTAFVLRAE